MACAAAQEPWGECGQVVHIRAAPPSDAAAVAATVEMWIVVVIHGENSIAEPMLVRFTPIASRRMVAGICGGPVDGMCAGMNESNQSSNHYNRFLD